MKTEHNHLDETGPDAALGAGDKTRMSRRDALALVGKHAVYTAPAVLAVLAATKSNSAHAVDSNGTTP